MKSFDQQTTSPLSSESTQNEFLLSFIKGEKKAIEVAHSVWQQVVQKGDKVLDATCGNGHDTLALIKMVSGGGGGQVYGLDIQKSAIEKTTALLNASFPHADDNKKMKETVELFLLCHSRMEEIVPKGSFVKLVCFNLGYLPGGDKSIITVPERTLEALEAASRIVGSGGLISVLVYVGHIGGKEEYETVLAFASVLPVDSWVCSKFEMVNRPLAPVLVFLFKK
ncbi:S-adenosyl-l-methionine-dependent methyltransferases superfamily protein [Thalictrum thalictroides]|uniref:S-adenosyl-l-methionine-dependent methyltransferases superfamily protein n=1 Tax=Thalictrum thalictroides TaxID=46969 RepID=A0A7J6VB01_THATH|nr:S-adenosyl-l-methionine-dependent methyltransferases superfamily protein [Thalictrum thalictroides]